MAKHIPQKEPRGLIQWIKDRRLQKQFRQQIEDTNAFEMYRTFSSEGPEDNDAS